MPGNNDQHEKPVAFCLDDLSHADQKMIIATRKARETVRFFLRELVLDHYLTENKCTVMGLKVMIHAAPDSSGPPSVGGKPEPDAAVEHVWLGDLQSDGITGFGVLQSQPLMVKGLNRGDQVRIALADIEDWMFVTPDDLVYGGFTIAVMRATMSADDRKHHDKTWDINFGDPFMIRLFYAGNSRGAKVSYHYNEQVCFQGQTVPSTAQNCPRLPTHPIDLHCVRSFAEAMMGANKSVLAGWRNKMTGLNLLQEMSMCGATNMVKALLRYEVVSPTSKTLGMNQRTSIELAEACNHQHVLQLLKNPKLASQKPVSLRRCGLYSAGVAVACFFCVSAVTGKSSRDLMNSIRGWLATIVVGAKPPPQ